VEATEAVLSGVDLIMAAMLSASSSPAQRAMPAVSYPGDVRLPPPPSTHWRAALPWRRRGSRVKPIGSLLSVHSHPITFVWLLRSPDGSQRGLTELMPLCRPAGLDSVPPPDIHAFHLDFRPSQTRQRTRGQTLLSFQGYK
jgi:hypothetical protein